MENKKENVKKKTTPKKRPPVKKKVEKVSVVEEIVTGETKAEEEIVIEEPKAENVIAEKHIVADEKENVEPVKQIANKEKPIKKITKKISRTFGYLWNGQMIDF